MAMQIKDIYKITIVERAFPTYRRFLQHYYPELLDLYAEGKLPSASHRFYLIGKHGHLTFSSKIVAVLQDIQTQKVFLINTTAIEKEGEYEYEYSS